MIIFVPIDDSLGMMFNKRRQSKDKKLREYILKKCETNKLWMNSYSKKQFHDTPENESKILIDENFLAKVGKGEYCFVETTSLKDFQEEIEKVFLCKWNRKYPGDLFFDIDLNDKEWEFTSIEEFEGSSHEKITIEEWRKK